MTRDDVTAQIISARLQKGLSWHDLAELIGRPPVWATAALLGQHPFTASDAATIADALGLDPSVVPVLTAVPVRSVRAAEVEHDPTIYRFHEAVQVYGPAIKELIHEEFGDGIMSAINFGLTVERRAHPGGDRVVVTFDGKFLPYDWPSE